ncbi:MAG: hypothetical protein CL797_02165 [Chromatiales bacterium]|nr:hypothetical protein [Chromatiales bacterium]MDP6435694.1 SCP2 sterol-binding domain-containing protein [Gammaproteobacteria bacterium]
MKYSLLNKAAQNWADYGVRRSETAEALCARLEGKSLLIDPGSTGLCMYLVVREGQLLVAEEPVDKPDATLSGSPFSLAAMAVEDPEEVFSSGRVSISGDSDIAADFRALLEIIRPDWEEELSRVTGDVVAHEASMVAGSVGRWMKRAGRSLGQSLSEYLTEDSRALAPTIEIEEFCSQVDQLSEAVDRAEERLEQLRTHRAKD